MVAAQVFSAPIVGHVADRYGNRMALISSSTALLCATLCAILAPSLEWFKLAYVFLGVHLGSEIMARYNIAIEYAPRRKRAMYFGLMNAVLAPFYGVSLLGGWISDSSGYQMVFYLGATFSIIGILFMVYGVKDPRMIPLRIESGREHRLPSGVESSR